MYKELYNEIASKRHRWQNETEVRQDWILALSNNLGINFDAERGKKDSSYNNVIIEFKDRGLFKGSTSSSKFIEAKDERLKKYIIITAKQEGRSESDYIGTGIDGDHIFFAQVINGEIIHGPLLPFSETSVGMVASACKNEFCRAVTAENLIEDFGLGSQVGTATMQALSSCISSRINALVHSKEKMLFEEWQTLYGQIANLGIEQKDRIWTSLEFKPSTDENFQVPVSLFVIHTYNSLLIKLVAAEIVSTHGLTSYPYFSQQSISLTDKQLLDAVSNDIEEGKLFKNAGINGFVEEAIFSWYLDTAKSKEFNAVVIGFLRDILSKIALYRTDKLDTARSKDVLKQLYQNLVPEHLRKSLGEFYTPDWLVNVTIDKAIPKHWIGTRVLDPTCGSGSFLLEAIRRKRINATEQCLSNIILLEDITRNVWGFDLNPLAVQTARVNFLIAISDLLKDLPGHEIEIPVLLADAIYSPSQGPNDKENVVRYKIGSQIANLEITIPVELAFDRPKLDKIFSSMEDNIDAGKEFDHVGADLLRYGLATTEQIAEWWVPLFETYSRVMSLHKRDWNGIWFRIVRNFFWSASAGQFDIIAGNPPWVRWSKLPELYRERAISTCLQYDIFSSNGHYGGNELDISAMITYTVADKWLKPQGSLVFVITQTLFQNASSEGFRRFQINDEYSLQPIEVDDLKALKPFKGATNRTAIAKFIKSVPGLVCYPIPYNVWDAVDPYTKAIPESISKEEVLERVNIRKMEATPAGSIGSPWSVLQPGRFQQLEGIQGKCSWVQGRKGITADLNGIYFVYISSVNEKMQRVQIATRPNAGKHNLGPEQTFWVEPNLLYPLLKGSADFGACRIHRMHSLYVFVPNKGILKGDYQSADDEIRKLPKTLDYFNSYERLLLKRSTFRLRMKNAPFFAIYNVGDYTFSPYKVIWAEQGKFKAAVISSYDVPLMGTRPFVPDHKVFFADFYEESQAYYLCGLLNSSVLKEYVHSHSVSIQIGNIFKHISLPEFDPTQRLHYQLSRLAKHAHDCKEDDYSRYISIVRRIADRILLNSIQV